MANKVLFEIEVDANFRDLIKLQTEMDKLQKEQKDAAKAGQKNTNIYQQNRQELKRLKDEYKHTEKQLKSNKTSTKALGTSYNDLTNHNKRLSAELRKIQNPLTKDKQLFDKLSASMHKNEQTLKKMDAAMGRNQRNVGNYGSALGGLGKSFLSSAAGALGLVGGVQLAFNAIGGAVNTIKEFEQAGANLSAVLGELATGENIAALAKDAKDLGASTAFSATEVRGLQTEFAKLGFKPDEIINATAATLDLAAATGTDLAEAAEVAGATLGGFGLNASETGRVADVMAKSFSISALDMEKFKESMKNAAPSAKTVGQTIEETTAQLATLSKAGITGSKAGSNLSTGFINLAAKGKTVKDVFAELAGKTGLERLNAAVDLVGKNAAKSFVILADGQETTKDFQNQLEDSAGAAEAMAAIQLDTLDGALKILSSSYEGLILSMEDGNGVMSNIAKIIVQDVSTALSLLSGNVSAADEQFSYLSIAITQIKLSFNVLKNVLKLVYLPFQALGKLAVKVAKHFNFMEDSADGVGDSMLFLQQIFVRLPAILDIVVKGITNSFLGMGKVIMELGRLIAKTFSIDTVKGILAGESPMKNAFAKVSAAAAQAFKGGLGQVTKEVKDLWNKNKNEDALKEAEELGVALGSAVATGVKKGTGSGSIGDIKLTTARTLDSEFEIKLKEETNSKILKLDAELVAEQEAQRKKNTDEEIAKEEEKRLADQKLFNSKLIDLAQQTSDAIFGIKAQQIERQKDFALEQLELQNELENNLLKSKLESGVISQEEYENNVIALKEKTALEQEKIEREAFEKKKRLDTAQALINGALAVTRIAADTPKGDYGVATAILIGAQVASTGVQVATIQSQQFADGGLLQGASHDQGGIPMTINGQAGYEAEGGEFIINREATAQNYQLLKSINESTLRKPTYSGYNRQFANGGLVSQGGISQVDLSRQAEVLAQQINQIKVVNVATETAAVNDNAIKIENEFTL